jgi:hypothetical protein
LSLSFAPVTALRLIGVATSIAVAPVERQKTFGPPIPVKIPLAFLVGMALLSFAWACYATHSIARHNLKIIEVGSAVICSGPSRQ